MSKEDIQKLFDGEVQITEDVARRLELVLGVPFQFWCNLEAVYRGKLERIAEEVYH